MKLLSVSLARVVWFLDTNELNPGGKDMFTHLIPALCDDYKFKGYPTRADDLSKGMRFTLGEFVKNDDTALAVNATIFSDSVTAETFSSTQDSEDFLDNVMNELPDLGFYYDPEMISRKTYVSQVVVRCTKRIASLNPALAEFARHVSSAVGEGDFETAAIELWPDQSRAFKPSSFSFQRKTGEPSNSNRYWSQAALQTDKHLELLEELERTLL